MLLRKIVTFFLFVTFCEGCEYLFIGNCYKHIPENNTKIGLRDDCIAWNPNADLVSIHSQKENGLYYDAPIPANPWTLDCPFDSRMTWSDASQTDYQHGMTCEPYWVKGDVTDGRCFQLTASDGQWIPSTDFVEDCYDRVRMCDITGTAHERGGYCKYEVFCNTISSYEFPNDVCSGHGLCSNTDICVCDEGYFGIDCEVYTCNGTFSNDSSVCSGKGNCTSMNLCSCFGGYYGSLCTYLVDGLCIVGDNETIYDDHFCYKNFEVENDFEASEQVCQAWLPSSPSHLPSLHSSEEEAWFHANVRGNDDNVWLGLKKFYEGFGDLFPCDSGTNYTWTDGTNQSYVKNEPVPVTCDSDDLCIGFSEGNGGWIDHPCNDTTLFVTTCKYKIPICNGILATETTDVCNGRGTCVSDDFCSCVDGFGGDDCENIRCFDEWSHEGACNSQNLHGNCIYKDSCECETGFSGITCEISSCYGFRGDDPIVCGGRGECIDTDLCDCDFGYAGENCYLPDNQYPCFEDTHTLVSGKYCIQYFNGDIVSPNAAQTICENSWIHPRPGGYLMSLLDENLMNMAILLTWAGSETVMGMKKEVPGTTCDENTIGWMNPDWKNTSFVPHLPIDCRYSGSTWNRFVFTRENEPVSYHFVERESTDCQRWCSYICMYEGPSCDGIYFQNYSHVCSGRGLCVNPDECLCSNPRDYYGQFCELTYCNNIGSNISEDVCSGRGTCWPHDTCSCEPLYFDEWCHVTTCKGEYSNDTDSVCRGHGTCWPYDICTCDDGYYGDECEVIDCYGSLSNDSDPTRVCSGHGVCESPDSCDCTANFPDYFGDRCQKTTCFGVYSTHWSRCSGGRGTCWPKDTCRCIPNYYGEKCEVTTCGGLFSNDSNVCGRLASCWPYERCACPGPPFIGEYCETDHPCTASQDIARLGKCYRNFGVVGNWNESEDACVSWFFGGHLVSIHDSSDDSFVGSNVRDDSMMLIGLRKKKNSASSGYHPCPPFDEYWWIDGTSDSYVISKQESASDAVNCSSNHTCFVIGENEIWKDVDCELGIYDAGCSFDIPQCNGTYANMNGTVCSGHGWCFWEDDCTCYDSSNLITTRYFGKFCNATYCGDYKSTNADHVCSGHGMCWPEDVCECSDDGDIYIGSLCEVTKCFSIFSNISEEVCSGHGTCWPKDTCSCNNLEGYYGRECNEYFNLTEPPFINFNESILYIPFHVPVDISVLFRRELELLVDEEEIDCGERIANWEEYLGKPDENVPEAKCWWELNDTSVEGSTQSLVYQINYGSKLYNKSENGIDDVSYPLIIRLLTEDENVTVFWVMKGDYVVPPRIIEQDGDGDDQGGAPIGGIVGGAIAGVFLFLIIMGALCAGILIACGLLCFLIVGMFVTAVCGIGAFSLICCFGGTAGATGAGAAVVGKEVHDEVMDEGPDFVKDAVKERWDRKKDGGNNIELDEILVVDGDEEEKYITDNLQEDILRKDEEFDSIEGLDLNNKNKDSIIITTQQQEEKEEDDNLEFGIDLEETPYEMTEEEKEVALRREEEYRQKLESRKEEERRERQERAKERAEREKILFDARGGRSGVRIKTQMEDVRKKVMDESLSLSLGDTKYARKKKRIVERKLLGLEQGLVRKQEKEVRKIERQEGMSLSLKGFEKRKRKERLMEEEKI